MKWFRAWEKKFVCFRPRPLLESLVSQVSVMVVKRLLGHQEIFVTFAAIRTSRTRDPEALNTACLVDHLYFRASIYAKGYT